MCMEGEHQYLVLRIPNAFHFELLNYKLFNIVGNYNVFLQSNSAWGTIYSGEYCHAWRCSCFDIKVDFSILYLNALIMTKRKSRRKKRRLVICCFFTPIHADTIWHKSATQTTVYVCLMVIIAKNMQCIRCHVGFVHTRIHFVQKHNA